MTSIAYTPAPNSVHYRDLDGFRALSILSVLAAHMLPLGPPEWKLNSTAGFMGMSVFFCLSGFLITEFLFRRPNIPIFLARRMARIAPLILLFTAVFCIILLSRYDSFIAVNTYTLNYWDTAFNPSIDPLWSLGVEMHFYLGVAFCVGLLGRRGFWIVPIAALFVTYLRIDAQAFGNIRTHLRVDEILSGSILALVWQRRDDPKIAQLISYLRLLFWPAFILWALSSWPSSGSLGYARPYFTAMMIGSVLARNKGWQKTFLSHRFLAYIATISFALYVWHSPFRHYWFDSGTDLERYLIKRPIGFLCIFFLAHLSTFYFEKPITDFVRRLTSRKKT